jgi:hypothetical protein
MSDATIIAAVTQILIDLQNDANEIGNTSSTDRQTQFTRNFIAKVRNQFPEKNALIVHSNHTANFVGSVTQSFDLLAPTPIHVSYQWYVFDSGTFTLQGDGGDNNVLFAGNVQQTADQTWVFSSAIPPPNPGLSNPGNSSGTGTGSGTAAGTVNPTPTQPIRSHPDGVYFVNCTRGSEVSSGLAYYKQLRDGGNDGQQPDDYVDVVHGSFTSWERSGSQIFSNGTNFSWNILPAAQQAQFLAPVGSASNTFNNYVVYKDNGRVLYTVDGFECRTLYWCF